MAICNLASKESSSLIYQRWFQNLVKYIFIYFLETLPQKNLWLAGHADRAKRVILNGAHINGLFYLDPVAVTFIPLASLCRIF